MIKAIIFDCFGVVLSDGFEAAYRHFGGDYDKDIEFIKQLTQDVSSGKVASSAPIIAEKLHITEEQWRQKNFGGNVIDHELLQYVLTLKQKYKTAMLSNIGVGGLKRFFEAGFLEKYFEVIVESAKIGFAKPEARAYEITADKLGVRLDECIFIDDRPEYVEGANHVGMHGILFTDLKTLQNDVGKYL